MKYDSTFPSLLCLSPQPLAPYPSDRFSLHSQHQVHALAKECCELMAVIGAKLRAPCCPRGVLLAVRMVVERLVEACAPGRDTGDSGDRSPGVSLTRVMKIAESLEDSLGSTAFVETCVAFHMHLLEWLAVLEGGFDDTAAVGGPEQAPPSGTSGAGSNKLATSNGSVCKTLSSELLRERHVFAA